MAARSPTGDQIELICGGQRLWVVEVGAGIRLYTVEGRQVLDGYGEDELCRSARGQSLLPWPNRIQDGRYAFGGEQRQLALTEPENGCAIHGLVRWANWRIADRERDRVTMEHVLHPQPGYPHVLELRIEYVLGDEGLTVRTSATNAGTTPCPFGTGAHPYVMFGSARADTLMLGVPARTRLLADNRGIPTATVDLDGSEYDFRVPRRIGEAKLDTAYTDFERDGRGRALVCVGSDDAETAVWFDERYRYVMLFTGDPRPDVDRRSVAVEPMTCAPNAFRTGDGLLTLEPGESFRAEWGIEPH